MKATATEQQFWMAFRSDIDGAEKTALVELLKSEADLADVDIERTLFRPLMAGEPPDREGTGWVVSECLTGIQRRVPPGRSLLYLAAIAVVTRVESGSLLKCMEDPAVQIFCVEWARLSPVERSRRALGMIEMLRHRDPQRRNSHATDFCKLLSLLILMGDWPVPSQPPKDREPTGIPSNSFSDLFTDLEWTWGEVTEWIDTHRQRPAGPDAASGDGLR